MYSNVKFYEKDNKLHEIYFAVLLENLKRANNPNENANTSNFNENKKQQQLLSTQWSRFPKSHHLTTIFIPSNVVYNHIYQPLLSGRIWHQVSC